MENWRPRRDGQGDGYTPHRGEEGRKKRFRRCAQVSPPCDAPGVHKDGPGDLHTQYCAFIGQDVPIGLQPHDTPGVPEDGKRSPRCPKTQEVPRRPREASRASYTSRQYHARVVESKRVGCDDTSEDTTKLPRQNRLRNPAGIFTLFRPFQKSVWTDGALGPLESLQTVQEIPRN